MALSPSSSLLPRLPSQGDLTLKPSSHLLSNAQTTRCMPTFLVYKDGKKTDAKLEGASPDALEALVKQFA